MSDFTYNNFSFPSLTSYVVETRKRLQSPLQIPEYAVAGEEVLAPRASAQMKGDPYLLRRAVFQAQEGQNAKFRPNTLRPIPFEQYPKLYRAAQFTMEAAKEFADLDVMIQIYQTDEPAYVHQAMAFAFLSKAWLYISEHCFFDREMFEISEICYLLGHALGHAQCCHTTLELLTGVSLGKNVEYSADRAGMIVCAKWLHSQGCSADELPSKALISCTAALDKLMTADSQETINLHAYDYDALKQRLDEWISAPTSLPRDRSTTHPNLARRALALYYFGQSEMFYRCLALTREKRHLCDDKQLQTLMNTLLTKMGGKA